MTRSVDEIYNALVAEKQGHRELDVLNNTSVTSIWRLMLYVVAFAINVLETLWDAYKSEVNTKIEAMTPHRAKWQGYPHRVRNDQHQRCDGRRSGWVHQRLSDLRRHRPVGHEIIEKILAMSRFL